MSGCGTCQHWRRLEDAAEHGQPIHTLGPGRCSPDEVSDSYITDDAVRIAQYRELEPGRWGGCLRLGFSDRTEVFAKTEGGFYCRDDFGCVEHTAVES